MTEELKRTVRILRRGKVETDDRGRSVWVEPVETTELELVSTSMLKKLLDSGDSDRRERLRQAAESREGVLAREVGTDGFEIIDDADLRAALEAAGTDEPVRRTADVVYEPVSRPAEGEELSLVSTQMLKKILGTESAEAPADGKKKDDGKDRTVRKEQGFDPYNSG